MAGKLRVKWFVLGAAAGFLGGSRTKSNVWEVEKLVEAVAPHPVAAQLKDYVFHGGADRRRLKRLEDKFLRTDESNREVLESVRQLKAVAEELIRHKDDSPPTSTPQSS